MKSIARSGRILATLGLCFPVAAFGGSVYGNGGPSTLNFASDLDGLGGISGSKVPVALADGFSVDDDCIVKELR